jgi:4-alpha-glucanotransferase
MSLDQTGKRLLRNIARSVGVATSYQNYIDTRIDIPDDTLIALINALEDRELPEDSSVDNLHFFRNMLRAKRIGQSLPEIVVAWDGKLQSIWAWTENADNDFALVLREDDGDTELSLPVTVAQRFERPNVNAARVKLAINAADIPYGYYSANLQQGGTVIGHSFVISSPAKMADQPKSWGMFAPAYALRSQRDWGIGGYHELYEAACQIKRLGGGFIGTLPLLPVHYDADHIDASPYSPSSRLFWNEIFLDLENLPGRESFTPDAALQAALDGLRADTFVDYAQVHAVKSRILRQAADDFFMENDDKGDAGFQDFVAQSPYLDAYADFRGDKNYHRYAQYACHVQLQNFKNRAEAGNCAELYLDYTVGVSGGGFDAQQFPDLFLTDFSVGAPPDLFYSHGQNWGFQPYNPRALVKDKFRYFRATIAHYFRYARMLRLDHILGLYRIFCIPNGKPVDQGAYVFFPFDAFLAILCVEAERHQGVLVGEDQGTVPPMIRARMKQHGIYGIWIGQMEMKGKIEDAFKTLHPYVMASFNTHDMYPLQAYLRNDDLKQLQDLGLLDDDAAAMLIAERNKNLPAWRKLDDPFLTGTEHMAASAAAFVMVTPDDAWGDINPQNIPGITTQYPNWRKKLRHPVETWGNDKHLLAASEVLNAHRSGKVKPGRAA